jgi:DNA replication protein DnaC
LVPTQDRGGGSSWREGWRLLEVCRDKSRCAQTIGHAVIQRGYRVLYRESHILLKKLADVTLDGNRKQHVELLTTVPLLIIDDLGMRKLPLTAAEELLEIIVRRYGRASKLIK